MTAVPGAALEAAAQGVHAYLRHATEQAAGGPHGIVDRLLPDTWEHLDPSWRARYRGIAAAALDGWHLHRTLHGPEETP